MRNNKGVSPYPLQHVQVPNLRDEIENQIVNAILAGAFARGERLVESTLADQLGVSRAPVREALAALEREGIVRSVPRRGYIVVDFTDKDIEEIYSLRLLLEIEALRRAMRRINAEDITALRQIVEELGNAITSSETPEQAIALDFSFHERICHLADHSRLYSAWNSMRMQTRLLIGLTSTTHYQYPDGSKQVHEQIVSAMVAKDLPRAEEALRLHILDAQERAMRVLRALRPEKQPE
ncbi:MAG TPA: hypothetical protein DEP84_23625 [Chloroflexi bacterium]|nr:hypothetical protein [Chloroflexota bacterium]